MKTHNKWIIAVFLTFSCSSWAQSSIQFSEACAKDENIEITAVGDVLLHSPLAKQATTHSQRFASLWSQVTPFLERSDLAYANLEGAVAPGVLASGKVVADPGFTFDGKVYSSYPQFNYHPYLIDDLKKTGFDIVSTANNHSLDRKSIGVDRTVEQLEKYQMPFTGTKSTTDMNRPWHVITQVKGRNIAWLSCTFSTNGIPDPKKQVLPCYENPKEFLNIVFRLSKDPAIDAIIVTPHWGSEYQHNPHQSQSWLGRQLIEAGATAVIGTHPHVVQPWEKYIAKDGREGFIMYSTGNFVSGQPNVERRTSVMVQLNLVSRRNQKLTIRGVQFLPILMQKSSRGYELTPVLQYDSSVPSKAVGIWKRFYHERHRITSSQENTVQKVCAAASQK